MSAVRLGVYYAAFFGMIGIMMPFWPVWLSARGLNASQIGLVLAATTLIRVVTNPMIAQYADRRGERRRIMVWLSFIAIPVFALFPFTIGFWTILIVSLLHAVFWSASQPLGESLTMLTARRDGFDYGHIRLWGSVAFIVTAIAIGRLVSDGGADIIFYASLAASVLFYFSCLALPKTSAPAATSTRFPIAPLLRDRRFLWVLLACALIQGSHAVYYGFGTLHWQSVGYSDTVIGLLWAEGVVAEIILFIFAAGLVAKIGPTGLIVLGGLAGALRWGLTSISDALPLLIVAQLLHAFTFGAAHLGAIHYINQAINPSLSATAQSLYSAAVMGFALGIATSISGALYGSIGSQAFFTMGVMAAAGGMVAIFMIAKDMPATPSH